MEYRITYIDTLLSSNFPKDFIPKQKKEIKSKFKFFFRLLNGDRNIYFEGLANRKNSFDPLDFLGREHGGTDLQYLENRKYLRL